MNKIWLTSDWHFCHDRKFVYEPRGFNNIEEMNEAIVKNHNTVVAPDDDVYVLGDLMLGDNEKAKQYIEQLNGKIHIVRGNHCTDKRWNEVYPTISNVVELVGWSTVIHYRKYHFYLSHFPTLTGNLEKESLHQMTLGLFGHTHSKDKFYEDRPYMYNVALDANHNTPVLLDDIIDRRKAKARECIEFL